MIYPGPIGNNYVIISDDKMHIFLLGFFISMPYERVGYSFTSIGDYSKAIEVSIPPLDYDYSTLQLVLPLICQEQARSEE